MDRSVFDHSGHCRHCDGHAEHFEWCAYAHATIWDWLDEKVEAKR